MCYLNCGRVIFIGVGYFLLCTAISGQQNIISKVFKDDGFGNLGFYALGAMYAVFGVSSFVSAPIIKFFGDRLSLVIGTIGYFIYISV